MKHEKPFFRAAVRNDGGSGVLELMVYEQIGENFWTGEGVTAKNFKQRIDQAAGAFSRISLRINSPGGDAFEGVAILNLLRSLGKPVDVSVDGIAASAASIIAMAGDTISMGSGAMMMIHNAWIIAMGNAQELNKLAATLSTIDGAIAQAYVDRTGQKLDAVKAMMEAETWMGADECVEKGFATQKSNAPVAEAQNLARSFKSELSRFSKVPANLQEEEPEEKFPAAVAVSQELFQDFSIPAMFARMAANQMDGCELALSTGTILAIRRLGSAVLNLASGPAVRVTGILAPYNSTSSDLGGFQEVYQSGCFNKWLALDDPRVLFNHNIDHVLGRKSSGTARFWEEADGLHYDADLPDTQVARDLRVSMQRGDVKESSAAFYIVDYVWENRSGVRTRVIKEARLVEGSPHSFAAYTESTATPEEEAQASAVNELELFGARLQLLKIA